MMDQGFRDYEHPDFGGVRVFFRWVPATTGYRWIPYAVEFDLFIPDSERSALTEVLEAVRLDKSVSVSAFDSHLGGF